MMLVLASVVLRGSLSLDRQPRFCFLVACLQSMIGEAAIGLRTSHRSRTLGVLSQTHNHVPKHRNSPRPSYLHLVFTAATPFSCCRHVDEIPFSLRPERYQTSFLLRIFLRFCRFGKKSILMNFRTFAIQLWHTCVATSAAVRFTAGLLLTVPEGCSCVCCLSQQHDGQLLHRLNW